MANQSLEKRNSKIRDRINKLKDVYLSPMPSDSRWLKPIHISYIQDGKHKNWDFVKARDCVAIVIFNISRKKLIFVRQFRPHFYLSKLPFNEGAVDVEKYPASLGMTLELCAGMVDKNKTLVEIAQDEVREECGYEVPISAFSKIISYR